MDQALRVAARKLYEAHSKNVPHALRWEQLSPEIQNKWGVEHQESVARSVTIMVPTEDPVLDEEWKQVQQFRLDSEGAAVTEDGWSQLSAEGRNRWRNRYRELRSSRPEGPSPLELEWKGARELYELADNAKPWAMLSLTERRQWRKFYRATGVEHQERSAAEHDPVNHPSHYTSSPSGIECIQVTEHMTFCLGNAVKYLWRAGEKGNLIQDLEKAVWYINREIARLSTEDATLPPVQTSTDNGVTWQPSKEVKVWPTVAEFNRAEMRDKVRVERDEYRESWSGGLEPMPTEADAKLARDLEKRGDR